MFMLFLLYLPARGVSFSIIKPDELSENLGAAVLSLSLGYLPRCRVSNCSGNLISKLALF